MNKREKANEKEKGKLNTRLYAELFYNRSGTNYEEMLK